MIFMKLEQKRVFLLLIGTKGLKLKLTQQNKSIINFHAEF